MVLYKCDKCLKEFNKKHNYEVHINRKFSCIKESNLSSLFASNDNDIILPVFSCPSLKGVNALLNFCNVVPVSPPS